MTVTGFEHLRCIKCLHQGFTTGVNCDHSKFRGRRTIIEFNPSGLSLWKGVGEWYCEKWWKGYMGQARLRTPGLHHLYDFYVFKLTSSVRAHACVWLRVFSFLYPYKRICICVYVCEKVCVSKYRKNVSWPRGEERYDC